MCFVFNTFVDHVDPCKSNPCLNDGTCTKEDKTYTCSCNGDYSGHTCESKSGRKICVIILMDVVGFILYMYENNQPLQHVFHYSVHLLSMFIFITHACQIPVDPCKSNPCLNGGRCTKEENNHTCSCNDD